MNSVNRTLYIPLYAKAWVSRRGMLLQDRKAEEIWAAEGFPLRGRSKSKYLALYMGMRAAVFDAWLKEKLRSDPQAVVVHIGCGLDSRILRVEHMGHDWFDVDFPQVIAERRRYFAEDAHNHMVAADVCAPGWLKALPAGRPAVVVMEGVSMYLPEYQLRALFGRLNAHFSGVALLMDCYSGFAARMSKHRNPVKDVGVSQVYGLDDPHILTRDTGMAFVQQHDMTPACLSSRLQGMEGRIFRRLYAGRTSRKLYRLYEYKSK